MSVRDLSTLDRDICQPLGRLLQEAFEDGMTITSKNLLNFAPAFVPNSARSNYAWAVGTRATELDVTMVAAVNQHFDPVQLNVNIKGADPTGLSTTNLIYANITHDTTDMANLRLKCSDWNVEVGRNVRDAYVYQGEIRYTAAVHVSGESAVLGLVMRAHSSAMTGSLRGMIISMEGVGFPAGGIGIELRSSAGVALGSGLAEGIRISGTPLVQVGIAMGSQTNNNEGPQNAFFFPSPAGADIGPCAASVATGDGEGSIKILIGASPKYLKYWATAS